MESNGWRRDKPLIEIVGDRALDPQLAATLTLDFDVRLTPDDAASAQAVVVVASPATLSANLDAVRRRSGAAIVLILHTARASDRVRGLEEGADDVIVEPYDAAELLARVRAVIRRVGHHHPGVIRVADLELDLVRRSVRRGRRSIGLSRTEFAILASLAQRSGAVVPHSLLLKEVWGGKHVGPTTMHTMIAYLRRKIEEPASPPLVHTVRGIGYALHADWVI